MVKNFVTRPLRAALFVFATLVWCWIITAFHGVWSFGIVHDYLNGGRVPLYPSIPVTYGQFFLISLPALVFPLLPAVIAINFIPQRFVFAGLSLIWIIGFFIGAGETAFTFQSDFGTTWGSAEALLELFYHPIVTPLSISFGLFATYALAQRFPLKD